MSEKVLVIGLDGTPLELVRPWMEKGLLPNLATFLREGVVTNLESVIPPQTASGWSSMITGKNPGKHGVFGFFKREPSGYDLLPVSASDRKSLDLWEILSQFEKKVGVFDVPVTYPVRKVKGFLVSGMLTPFGVKDYCYPANLVDELDSKIGSFSPPFTLVTGNEETVEGRLNSLTDNHGQAILYLLDNKEWNFFMTVFHGTDRIQHVFWKYMEENSNCDAQKRSKYRDAILRYYQKVDGIIGEILLRADDNTTVFIVSDHGAGQLTKWVHPNVFLLKEGFLKIRRGVAESLRYLLFSAGISPLNVLKVALALNVLRFKDRVGRGQMRSIMNKFFLSLKDIDWSRSAAYSFGGWGRVFINLKGKFPQGMIESGREYEDVMTDIISRLKELEDPETGKKICAEIYRKEQIYDGPYLDEAPDIVYQLTPGYYSFPDYEFGSKALVTGISGWSAGHTLDGVLMMKGKNISRMMLPKAKIVDVAPTVLALLGLPVPTDMDGRVLVEAFSKEFAESNQVSRIDYTTQKEFEHTYTDEQVDELKKTLRGLGYL